MDAPNPDASTPRLKMRPLAAEYLRRVAEEPQARQVGDHTSLFLHKLGFVDDEVEGPGGETMTADDAARRFGKGWYMVAQFTGKDRITEAGQSELEKLNK